MKGPTMNRAKKACRDYHKAEQVAGDLEDLLLAVPEAGRGALPHRASIPAALSKKVAAVRKLAKRIESQVERAERKARERADRLGVICDEEGA